MSDIKTYVVIYISHFLYHKGGARHLKILCKIYIYIY